MRWPWVSRALLEAERRRTDTIERVLGKRADELRNDLTRERVRTAKLTAAIIRLKRDGAVLLPERALTMTRREPTAFEKAVDDNPRARADGRLRAHLLRYAEDQMRKHPERDQEEIAEEIRNWSVATHDDDDATEEESGL